MAAKVIKKSRSVRRRGVLELPFTKEMITATNVGGPLASYAENAWEIYEKLDMPTKKDEPWRRTDLRLMKPDDFSLVNIGDNDQLMEVPEYLLEPLVGERNGGQITIRPGAVDVEMDPKLADQGVLFMDLFTAAATHPEILEKILGKVVRPEEGKFAALTSALANSGVLLYVPKGVQVEEPLHSVVWAPGGNKAYFSRVMVYIEDGASATYLHESASPSDEEQSMNASIVEIYVGQGANFRFVELQSLGRNMWNFTHERARVEKDANLDWIFGAVGSRLTKNFTDLDLIGIGANGRMSGFFFTDGNQHLDHDTQQNHLAAHTTSDLLFKGALMGKSRSVWQGMIYVAEGAQQTDGYQANRNLVLDPDARADSIPGLEILADDVRCTHGATVGKIDPELVFYLRTRGIPTRDAERMVVDGFFDPIMQRIPYEGVRNRFQESIKEKMA